MVIWIASYPRSGNTLFRLLLYHLYGIPTFSLYDDPVFDQLEGVSELVGHRKLPASLHVMSDSSIPHFVKTHELPCDDNPAVYLARDGRDALVSYAHYAESFYGPFSWRHRVRKLLGLSNYPYILGDLITSFDITPAAWSDHVRQWTHRRGLTFTVRYEDLLEDPAAWVDRALKAIGYDVRRSRNADLPSFEELHERWPKFFRRGETASWRDEMTDELHELFWQHHGDAMRELGYKR
jgi:hypothetical protein